MSDLSRFFKHSTIYAIGNLINRIGAFALLPVYTNYLTVEQFGQIELFYVFVAMVTGFVSVGIAHATLRFYFDYEDQLDRNKSISTNFIGSFAITVIGAIFVVVFAEDITLLLFGSTELQLGIYLMLAAVMLELSSQICFAYIRAIEYSKLFVYISIAKLFIQISVNSYLVIIESAGVIGVLIGNLIAVFVGWLVLSVYTLWRCGIAFELGKFIPVLKYGFPFLLSTITMLISTNTDKLVVTYLVSIEALGIYALALKFSQIMQQLIGTPFSHAYGAFRYTIMDKDDAGKIQADIVRYLLILAAFLALAISLFVSDLLNIMSSEEFSKAARYVPLLMVAAVIHLLRIPSTTGIFYAKKTKYIFYFSIVTAVVSPLSNIYLISFIGLYGACISLIITELTVLILMNYFSRKFFEVNYDYRKILIIVSAAVFIFVFSIQFEAYSPMIYFTIKVILLVSYVGFLFWSPAVTPVECNNLRRFCRSRLLKFRSS